MCVVQTLTGTPEGCQPFHLCPHPPQRSQSGTKVGRSLKVPSLRLSPRAVYWKRG